MQIPVKLKKTAPSCPEPEIVSTSLGEPGRQPVCRSTVAAGPPSGWGSLGSVAMTPQEPAVFPARHFPHSVLSAVAEVVMLELPGLPWEHGCTLWGNSDLGGRAPQ